MASFNIRNGIALDWRSLWWRRRASTLDAIGGLGADIVALQEAYRFQWEWLSRRLRMPAAGARGRGPDGGEACPVLFDPSRVSAIEARVHWYSETPTEPGSKMPSASHPRIAAITTLACDGAVFTVANTHLDQRHAHNRRRGVEQLVEWVGDGPAVLVGDFNAAPDDGELEPLRAAGFRRVGLDGEAEGTSHAFSGRADLIDHCFVSAHWQTIAGRVDRVMPGGRFPSDHWPIVVDISLNGS